MNPFTLTSRRAKVFDAFLKQIYSKIKIKIKIKGDITA